MIDKSATERNAMARNNIDKIADDCKDILAFLYVLAVKAQ